MTEINDYLGKEFESMERGPDLASICHIKPKSHTEDICAAKSSF